MRMWARALVTLLAFALPSACSHTEDPLYVFVVSASQPQDQQAVRECATGSVRATEGNPGLFSVVESRTHTGLDKARRCIREAGLEPGSISRIAPR